MGFKATAGAGKTNLERDLRPFVGMVEHRIEIRHFQKEPVCINGAKSSQIIQIFREQTNQNYESGDINQRLDHGLEFGMP